MWLKPVKISSTTNCLHYTCLQHCTVAMLENLAGILKEDLEKTKFGFIFNLWLPYYGLSSVTCSQRIIIIKPGTRRP